MGERAGRPGPSNGPGSLCAAGFCSRARHSSKKTPATCVCCNGFLTERPACLTPAAGGGRRLSGRASCEMCSCSTAPAGCVFVLMSIACRSRLTMKAVHCCFQRLCSAAPALGPGQAGLSTRFWDHGRGSSAQAQAAPFFSGYDWWHAIRIGPCWGPACRRRWS